MIPLIGFVLSPIGRSLAMGFALLAVAGTIYGKGYAAASRRCDATALRSQIVTLQADLNAARKAAADDAARTAILSATEKRNMEKVHALEAELAKRSSGVCRLDRRDARRLRGL